MEDILFNQYQYPKLLIYLNLKLIFYLNVYYQYIILYSNQQQKQVKYSKNFVLILFYKQILHLLAVN